MTLDQMIAAALELAKLYQGFADRAKSMSETEARAAWDRVNANATAARGNWDLSKGGATRG